MKKIEPFYAFQAGWVRYKNNAGKYSVYFLLALLLIVFGMDGAAMIGSLLSTILGPIGLFSILIVAVCSIEFLWLGYAHFAKVDEQMGIVQFEDFFGAFRKNRRQLLGVYLTSFLLSVLAIVLMFTLVPLSEAYNEFLASIPANPTDDQLLEIQEDIIQFVVNNPGPIYRAYGTLVVVRILFSFAGFKASFEGTRALQSFKWSVANVGSNFLAVFFWFFTFVIVLVVSNIASQFIGIIGLFPLVVLIPWLLLTRYDMYTQIRDETEAATTGNEDFEYDN
jgi:hypothetical protein